MARLTQAQIGQMVPEFLGCDPTIAGIIIANAELVLNPNLSAAQLPLAEMWLVGHIYLTAFPANGQGAIVESETAGDVTANYKMPDLGKSSLSTTRYGMLYLQLARAQGFGAGVT